MKTRTWTICISDPSPAMTSTKVQFDGTYIEACNEARRRFQETGRNVIVRTGSPSSYYFRVSRSGEENRNTNAATR